MTEGASRQANGKAAVEPWSLKVARRARQRIAAPHVRARCYQHIHLSTACRRCRVNSVLLVDDHPMIGAALEMLLRETSYKLVGRARTIAEATSAIVKHKPSLLLLDVNLPDGSGIDLLRRISHTRSRPKVILLTAGMDDHSCLRAADLNPEGMVLKTSDPQLLTECLDAVSLGEQWIDPRLHTGRAKLNNEPRRRRRSPAASGNWLNSFVKGFGTAISPPNSASPKEP